MGDVEGVEVNRPTIIVFLPFLDGLVDARWFFIIFHIKDSQDFYLILHVKVRCIMRKLILVK